MFFWNNEGLNPNAVVGSARRDIAFSYIFANDTTIVSVYCDSAHGLTRSDIIAIYGLNYSSATGFYYVSQVISDTVFTYETFVPIPSGQLQNSTTILFQATVGVPYGYTKVPYLGSTTQYTVSGTVVGNTGTVTVTNNGAIQVVTTDGGSFIFPPQDDLTTYDVLVTSVPVGQVASVTNGSGTINGANVTDVLVTCSYLPSNEYNLYEFQYNEEGEILPRYYSIKSLTNGTVAMLGGDFGASMLFTGYNPSQDVQKWNTEIIYDGALYSNFPYQMCVNPDNGDIFFITQVAQGGHNVFGGVFKYDIDGNFIFSKKLDLLNIFFSSNFERGGIYMSAANDYVLINGYSRNPIFLPGEPTLYYHFVIKLDLDGNLISLSTYIVPNAIEPTMILSNIVSDQSNNSYFVSCSSLIKIDSSNSVVWSYKLAGSAGYDYGQKQISIGSDGNLIVLCSSDSSTLLPTLMKINSSTGAIIWQGIFSPTDTISTNLFINDITLDDSNNIYICGKTNADNPTIGYHTIGYVAAMDYNGAILWQRQFTIAYGVQDYVELYSISVYKPHPGSVDELVMSGYISSTNGETTANIFRIYIDGSPLGRTEHDYLNRELDSDEFPLFTLDSSSLISLDSVTITQTENSYSFTYLNTNSNNIGFPTIGLYTFAPM
jgi:hypothetical protein